MKSESTELQIFNIARNCCSYCRVLLGILCIAAIRKRILTFLAFDLRECNSPGTELLVATFHVGVTVLVLKKKTHALTDGMHVLFHQQ